MVENAMDLFALATALVLDTLLPETHTNIHTHTQISPHSASNFDTDHTETQTPDRALVDGAESSSESLDVGNKSDGPYWTRPSIIFYLTSAQSLYVCVSFMYSSALLSSSASSLYASRDNAII